MSPEEAIAVVEAAFAGAPRPSNAELLHPDCADDADIVALYAFDDWRGVPDDVLEREYAALSFLSASGFLYFLPAYMRFALRHPDGGAAVVSSTVWSLQPSLYDEPLAAFARSKFVLLDAAHRRAIVAFLEAMAPYEDTTSALDDWGVAGA
ncbi:MAG TPA: DUF6714 family protein [Actinomycetota bacterium]